MSKKGFSERWAREGEGEKERRRDRDRMLKLSESRLKLLLQSAADFCREIHLLAIIQVSTLEHPNRHPSNYAT